MYDIFYIGKKTPEWGRLKQIYPFLRFANSYEDAVNKTYTKLFWIIWDDILVADDFDFTYLVPEWDQDYVHVFKNGESYDGVCLIPKNKSLSKREIEYRFFTEKKEIDIKASEPKPYDRFVIKNYNDYLEAFDRSSTTLFWVVPNEVEIVNDFDFPTTYERNLNHMFGHEFRGQKTFNGLMLLSKIKKVTKKEIDFRFILERKEHDEIVTRLKPYDIVFISYNEPDADKNYEKLIEKFPRAKRVHGVKGIHNAHIEAAKLSDTEMFWVVDGDAIIADDFKFNYEVSRYDVNCVHVWHSQNPINGLIYGYGGVKLLPRELTINMDKTAPDMTTSISKDMKVVSEISNITAFNTDPFNTWKSAFRECVKLSSRSIRGQIDKETEERLQAWISVGEDKPYGEYAIAGAAAGKKFAETESDSIHKINDFAWLEKKFKEENDQ